MKSFETVILRTGSLVKESYLEYAIVDCAVCKASPEIVSHPGEKENDQERLLRLLVTE